MMEEISKQQNPNYFNDEQQEAIKLRNRKLGLTAMLVEANEIEIKGSLNDEDTLKAKTNTETEEPTAYIAELPKIIARIDQRLSKLEESSNTEQIPYSEAA